MALCKGIRVARTTAGSKWGRPRPSGRNQGTRAEDGSEMMGRFGSVALGFSSVPRHLNNTRVPRIFCVLSVPRNVGRILSISSKYEESAGVFCCDV
jgi:hypothetical protein